MYQGKSLYSNFFPNWSTNDWSVFVTAFGEPTVWQRRCMALKKELGKKDIKADVSRHNCFDIDYYVVRQLSKKDTWDAKDVANALDLSNDCACLADYHDGIGTYWVKEDVLNDKYLNDCGELVFEPEFDFVDLAKNLSAPMFSSKLNSFLKTISCYYDTSSELLMIQYKTNQYKRIEQKLLEVNLALDDFVYSVEKVFYTDYSMLVINMEEVLYGDQLSQRFYIDNDVIKDFQSDWSIRISDDDRRFLICAKLNTLDDEKWEYRKKYNSLKTKLHKISVIASDKK